MNKTKMPKRWRGAATEAAKIQYQHVHYDRQRNTLKFINFKLKLLFKVKL